MALCQLTRGVTTGTWDRRCGGIGPGSATPHAGKEYKWVVASWRGLGVRVLLPTSLSPSFAAGQPKLGLRGGLVGNGSARLCGH